MPSCLTKNILMIRHDLCYTDVSVCVLQKRYLITRNCPLTSDTQNISKSHFCAHNQYNTRIHMTSDISFVYLDMLPLFYCVKFNAINDTRGHFHLTSRNESCYKDRVSCIIHNTCMYFCSQCYIVQDICEFTCLFNSYHINCTHTTVYGQTKQNH